MRLQKKLLEGWLAPMGFAFIALCLLIYCLAAQDPETYPEGLAFAFPGLLAFMSLLFLVRLMLAKRDGDATSAVHADGDWRRLGIAGLALAFYVVAMPFLGFVVSTFLFQGVIYRGVFDKRGPIWLFGVPGVTVLIFSVFFLYVLSVPLPRGALFYALATIGAG
ncbi:MAG: tripartite tricarboxylate transporter TctB family protein [Pseudomonadota bacterium]